MKKKLLFITFLMLFCSTMFGQDHYVPVNTGQYSTSTTFISVISFDGVEQEKELELGVFCNDEVRASVRTSYNPIKKRYIATASVKGQSGDVFKFKVYDHSTKTEWSNDCTITYVDKNGITRVAQYVTFDSENGYGTSAQPCIINFNAPLHWTYNDSFENGMIVNSIVKIDNITQQNTNYELGVFCGDDVRGSAKLNSDGTVNTMVYGNAGNVFTFNLYDPNKGEGFDNNGELIFTEVNNITFNENGYFNLEVNFITAPYVAQIGNNKYLSFDAALEAAEDGDNIELLKSIDLGTTTAVISKAINIALNNFTITSTGTGTVELANKGATITGAENGVTSVTTNVEGYKVVYEDGKYKLVKKLSGEIAYRAYVTDTESVEAVSVELENVYASSSLKVELYNVKDAVKELLVTTTYAKTDFPIDADSFTCFMVLSGTPNEYWNTTINAEELTIENLPTTIKLYVDGELVDTFDNALGAAGTNEDETEKYKALDCVYDYEVAKVGDKVYWNINNAIANWTAGSTLTLLEDVTLSDVITLKSTEHHILNLDTYTMTAAEGKNAIEIKSYGFENRNERAALTIMADETNPDEIGTIDAGAKSCIYYKYDATLAGDKYDRPIIYIEGGVYEGSSSSGISSTGHSTAQDKCATFNISGGTFNCGLNLTKTKLLTSGGLFNKSVSCTGGSTSIRLISGGTFESWGWMTADAASKFAVGTAISQYNVGVYVDDKGYLVVGGPVITEAGTTFKASTANYSGWSSYLEYSSAATNDLYYTSVEEALADNNNNTTSSVNIYVSELDLTGTSYKGTLVITEPLTVTFAEGTTPAWKVASGEDGHEVGYTESVENGVVTRVYTLFTPVAQVGETSYATLQEAIDATTSENTTVKVLQDITLEQTATIAAGKVVVLDLNGKTINAGWEDQSAGKHIYAFTNNGTLTINNSSTEANGTINARGNFNYGTMTLVNGTINAIDGNGGYGVRNYDGATFTMNGGTIATTLEDDNKVDEGGYDASPVRVDEGATFTMYGGVINNICDFTVAIDNYGTTIINDGEATTVHTTLANSGTMTINGGSFTCNGLENITAHALWAAAGTTTINGGTFDGKDNYNGFNVCASEGATVYITGGNFLPVHSGSLYGKGTIVVSGGTFFDPVPEARCAEGYIPTTNADGTYGVKPGSYVAQVGEVKYETLEAALAAAKASSENDAVTILKTIVLSETQTIDFENIAVTSTVNPAFRITSGAAVTVKNGNMNTKDGGYNFILGASDDASSYGNLTISSGKYHGATTVASVTRGALTITGGEFSVEPYQGNYAFLINCIDANYKNGTASVAIIGGTFHNWNPQNNAAEGAGTDFCHVDYAATETAENVWTVLPAVAKIGEARFATLQDAVDAAQANETINLIAYVELTTYVTIDKSVNLNLGQFNITRENGTALYVNGENVEVTIDGEGTVSGLQAVYVDNGTVTINGGNYVGGYEAVYVINNGHAVINGGTFGAENDEDDTDFVLNEYDETRNVTTITVYGGTFHGFNPQNNAAEGAGTNFCAEGYGTVESSTGVWEVVPMQGMKLYAGWNWFSSYVDINGKAGWENLKTGLGSNAMLVKNQNSMSQYYNTDNIVGWDGTLEETSVKEMYMIRMSADHDLTLTGKLVDPSENPITLHHNGWTWIGYPMNQDLALEDVLKGFNPNAGDRIKSHQGFSQYYDNELYEGWWGTLETMTPGYGYMYYNAGENNATLKYSYPADGSKSELRANITSENNYWVPASSQYAGNMNIVAMLEADGDNYEIAAFVGGEVRGSARPIYVEPLDAYMFFLTVHGEDVEEMTFKVYDLATGEEYDLNDRMNYTDNAIVGSITEPYIFRGTVGVGETSLSEVNVYPNPTTIGNEINLGTECDTVEVFNALGVKVAEYQNVDTVDALETAGVYVIRITNDGNVQNCRLIVK